MRVDEALERLDEIHGHLAKSEVYRGFRVPTVLLVAVLAVVAAALQPPTVGFIPWWSGVAALGAAIGAAAALRAYFFREDDFARRKTRRLMVQFTPSLAVGAALALIVAERCPDFTPFLPGAWAALFGLGVLAASPYFHSSLSLVGAGYVLAGIALLMCATPGSEPSGWSVGLPFAAGHFATALALRLGERTTDD